MLMQLRPRDERPDLPLRERVYLVGLGAVEGYVLEGSWASLHDWDQASGLEPDRGQRLDSHPAEPVTQFAPASQIVRVQYAGPVDVVIQADLVLDSVAREDVLHDKCQVPYGQLVPELLSQFTGQRGSAWLAEATRPPGKNQYPRPSTVQSKMSSPRQMTAAARRLKVPPGPLQEMSDAAQPYRAQGSSYCPVA